MNVNFDINDQGTLVLFTPQDDFARSWWEENVGDGPKFGHAFAVERRYAIDILAGIQRINLEGNPNETS